MTAAKKSATIPGLAARRAATMLVDGVIRRSRPLDEQRDEPGGPLAALDARERALARAIAGATLRRLGNLRALIAARLDKGLPGGGAGPLETVLLTGAAQILFLDSADHAAVSLAVDQARAHRAMRPFAPLVNAVLRGIARDRNGLGDFDPVRDVPAWLHARRIAAYGADTARAIAAAERHEAALDITVKSAPETWAERLGGTVLPTGSIRLAGGGAVTALDGYDTGEWWVQDAAAALPARLLRAGTGMRVLDLCAAPGGKTAQLAGSGAHVTALDRSERRLSRLRDNMRRLRLEQVETIAADALTWEGPEFDAVLLDAPCSATGTIRRHPDVAWLKGEKDIAALATHQARLLDKAAGHVRPGGVLVYTTCSLEPEEGERQIAAFLARDARFTRIAVTPEEVGGCTELITSDGDLRTLPCHFPDDDPMRAGLDGFYAARLARAG